MSRSKMTALGVVGAALLATAVCGTAQAQPAYAPQGYGQPAPAYGSHPLTVQRRYVPVAPAYDPYTGPKALVTAPIATAGNIVALPFRVLNANFPAYGNPGQNPFVLIGAPIHAAGQIAQVPFRAAQAPLGGYDYEGSW